MNNFLTNKLKRTTIIVFLLILIVSLAGCKTEEDIQPTSVIYEYIGAEPYAYDVYIFTPDKIIYYDLKEYAWDTSYDYFEDALPAEDQYRSKEYALTKNDWDRIVNAINDNQFSKLPEDVSNDDIMDVGTFFIEIKTEDAVHFSGGWGAGYGDTREDKKFRQVEAVLMDVFKECSVET